MTSQTSLQKTSSRISLWASIIAIAAGCVVLTGWVLDNAALKSVVPGFVSMKANTAICFILAGAALFLLQGGAPGLRKVIAGVCAIAVIAIASLSFAENVFGLDFHIDQALFRDVGAGASVTPGRMAYLTSFSFIMVGLAQLLSIFHDRNVVVISQFAALLSGFTGLFALISYVYGAEENLTVGSSTAMALNTGMVFIILSLGVLVISPDRGLVGIITTDWIGSVLARRLLPLGIGLMILLGWFHLEGEKKALYGHEMGVTLLIFSSIIMLTVVVVWVASSMNRLGEKRSRAEAALRRSNDRFNLAVAGTSEGIWEWEIETNKNYFSPRFCELLGYGPDELTQELATFESLLHPEDHEVVFDRVRRHLEARFPYDVEYRLRTKNKKYRWFRARGQAVWDESGKPLRMAGSISDITQRKQAEDERRLSAEKVIRLNEQLESHASSLEEANKELEAFSYSVSHDLRAPLRAIDGFSRVLLEDYRDRLDEEGRRFLNTLCDNTQKMDTLINDILTISRLSRHELRPRAIDMKEIAIGAFDELKTGSSDGKIDFRVNEMPLASGDTTLTKQIFANLLSNAIKFSRTREKAVIEVGGREEGNRKIYYVKDNGVGFDMKYSDKLFEVFQRLHSDEEFEGTGAGLSIVKRAARKQGGTVWGEGIVDKGATFYFALPADQLSAMERGSDERV